MINSPLYDGRKYSELKGQLKSNTFWVKCDKLCHVSSGQSTCCAELSSETNTILQKIRPAWYSDYLRYLKKRTMGPSSEQQAIPPNHCTGTPADCQFQWEIILWGGFLFKTHQRAIIAQVPCKYLGPEFHLLQFPNDWNAFPSFVMLWKLEQSERILFSTHNWNIQLGFLTSTKKPRRKDISPFQQEKEIVSCYEIMLLLFWP